MINGCRRAAVDANELRSGELGQPPEVGGRVAGRSGQRALHLVQLIIHGNVLVVVISPPTLVSVGCRWVGRAADDGQVAEVGEVVNRERVLVEGGGNRLALPCSVRSVVLDNLSIVRVLKRFIESQLRFYAAWSSNTHAIEEVAAEVLGSQRVGNVDHVRRATAALLSNNHDVVGDTRRRCDDVVCAAEEVVPEDGISLERDRLGGETSGQQAPQVEDLNTVVGSLGTDVDVVADSLGVSPERANGGSGKATEVLLLSRRGDFYEGSTVRLSDDSELSAVLLPTPNVGTLSSTSGSAEFSAGE